MNQASRSVPHSAPHRPLVDFMIIGAQKCGTSALHRFLDQHPQIGMSSLKEVHLFDAPEYSKGWPAAQIDERYRPHFAHCPDAALRGEATPIYIYLPDIAPELKRYNPRLKLIALLRDPVERAISHYYMEKSRNQEDKPLWLALLMEPLRLARDRNPRAPDSAARRHSYRHRGLYSRQLRNVFRCFGKDRVLVIRSQDLQRRHEAVLRQTLKFLGAPPGPRIPAETIFLGRHPRRAHRLLRWLLRLSYLAESIRLRILLRQRSMPA